MESCFICWDNSNINPGAQRLAEERTGGPGARYRVRVHFDSLSALADANRPVERGFAVGSIPPELRQLSKRMEANGIEVTLFVRGGPHRGEEDVPDLPLQLRMLADAFDYIGDPGIAVLLSGGGAGYLEGAGFHRAFERMHDSGWRIAILSWAHSCNPRMRQWAEANGVFVALDDFYEAITFMVPSSPGHEFALTRSPSPLDLSLRPTS